MTLHRIKEEGMSFQPFKYSMLRKYLQIKIALKEQMNTAFMH